MKSAHNMKRLFEKAVVHTRSAPDEAIFENVRTAYERSIEDKSTQPKPIFGRFVMKSPKTRPAIAAIILVFVGAAILLLWQGAGPGVALADVLTKIEQITAYTYEISITRTRPSQSEASKKSTGTALISRDHGMKMSTETIDPNGESTSQEIYVLPQKRTLVMIEPHKKSYERYKLNDTMVESFREKSNDPRSMIKKMLICEYSSLGQSVIDGISVEGFQTTDPAYSENSAFGQADVKVWVDVETRLPVRSETFVTEEIDGEVRSHRVLDNFRWNVPVDAAEFEFEIPDDYSTRSGDITVPAFNEETAIKGFTVLADLAGEYPDNLGGKTFFKELEALLAPMRDRGRSEKYAQLEDITMPIGGLLSFYQTLVQGKKDPAYYGEFVTPKDADLVLMRWKVSDNEYRVIFGDRHAETVTAEVLKELEKELPNNDKND
jgi:outer membrane lipoprotein-sorting protein